MRSTEVKGCRACCRTVRNLREHRGALDLKVRGRQPSSPAGGQEAQLSVHGHRPDKLWGRQQRNRAAQKRLCKATAKLDPNAAS